MVLEVVNRTAQGEGDGPRAFRLVGELDAASVEVVAALVADAPPGPLELRLDLSELTFMGSEGVHLMVNLARTRTGPGELVLVNPTRPVKRIIDLTGIERLPNLRVLSDVSVDG